MIKEFYFTYKDKQYECGSVVILKDDYFGTNYERVFLCHVLDSDNFLYQKQTGGPIYSMSGADFMRNIVAVKEEICTSARENFIRTTSGYNRAPTITEELTDDNLLIAWMWYIFIIIIAIIFKDRIAIWALVSFVFFKYRKRKLRKRGFKI